MFIHLHNTNFKKGTVNYRLSRNQFTDMTVNAVRKIFPITKDSNPKHIKPFESENALPDNSHDLSNFIQISVQNQGLKCNSGWAYASATAFEISRKKLFLDSVEKKISAQHLIDCVGDAKACRKQNPYEAFKYYTSHSKFYYENDYPNTPFHGQKLCYHFNRKNLKQASCRAVYRLYDNETVLMKEAINYFNSPIVLHFNQMSFEFTHYSKGIFTQNDGEEVGSHFMTIVGYGRDSKGVEFWKVQNSFGLKWGEDGHIRLAINRLRPTPKIALIPAC